MRAGNSRLLAASGGTPISANGVRKRALSAASTRSQWGSIVNPMPDGGAVDRGDERLVERLQRLEQHREARVDRLAGGQAGHLVEVLARPRTPGRRR